VLAGEQTIDEIILNPLSWYAEHGITAAPGQEGHDDRPRAPPRVIADDGTEAEYDRLLLATGSNPSSCRCPARTWPA
jgi:nitrite reductase (NADH) large subunit